MYVCVCVCACVRVCRNVNQIKTPLINSEIKLTCQCYFCTCQHNNKQMPILGNKAFQIYHKFASTLYIDRWILKQQCQHGMRLRRKP